MFGYVFYHLFQGTGLLCNQIIPSLMQTLYIKLMMRYFLSENDSFFS